MAAQIWEKEFWEYKTLFQGCFHLSVIMTRQMGKWAITAVELCVHLSVHPQCAASRKGEGSI